MGARAGRHRAAALRPRPRWAWAGRCRGDRDHQAAVVLPLALPMGGLARPQGAVHHPRGPDRGPARDPVPRPLEGAGPAAPQAVDRARRACPACLVGTDDLRCDHGAGLAHRDGRVTGGRFTSLLLGVSALAALAVALIAEGADGGRGALEATGGLIGVVALLGVAALARIVVFSERARRQR